MFQQKLAHAQVPTGTCVFNVGRKVMAEPTLKHNGLVDMLCIVGMFKSLIFGRNSAGTVSTGHDSHGLTAAYVVCFWHRMTMRTILPSDIADPCG